MNGSIDAFASTDAPREGEPAILVVAPPSPFAAEARTALLDAGFSVAQARDADEALRRAARAPVAVALLSLMLPDGDALALLGRLRAASPGLRVIAAASANALNRAAAAMRGGAFDYVVQPVTGERVVAAVRAALRDAESPAPGDPEAPPPGFVGSSAPMRALHRDIRRLGPALAPVLIRGERGTGRRLAARALHLASPRAAGPFLALDCVELGDDRLDLVLFGPSEFVPAPGGALQAAREGTLLLEGIGGVGPTLQSSLLRLLRADASSGTGETPRLVFATASDLGALVREGRFREELHYRLAIAVLRTPALRERAEDLPELAATALRRLAEQSGRRFRRLHPETPALLAAHDWPGNLPQLVDVLRRAVEAHDADALTPAMLPAELFDVAARRIAERGGGEAAAERAAARWPGAGGPAPSLARRVGPLVGERLADVELALIEATLARCGGSMRTAARMLGVAPSTLYRRLGRVEGAGGGEG